MTNDLPFIIVGSENCKRCDILHSAIPHAKIVKIPNKPLGLGDTIAYFTDFLRIKSCKSCKVRRSILNDWFPYTQNASKEIRAIRNTVLKLGQEELPVLLDKTNKYLHNIDDYVPGFTDKYMKTH